MQERLGRGFEPAPTEERRRWIVRFRRLLVARADLLLDLIEREIGKPRHEALLADLMPLLAACRWHERHLRSVLRARRVRGGPIWMPGQRVVVERAPLGRVAIIATWNYPVQLLGIQLLQALAGGNEVVVKPSERAPRTQALLLETARDAGLPARALAWTDATREAGQALLLTERFDHIVFTGSTEVGRAIAEIAAQSLTPTTLELSGQDSAFVLDDADCELAARTLWHAITLNAGQTCMAPRRILVEDGAYRGFLAALAPRAAGARPLRLIDDAAARQAHALAAQAVAAGGRSLSGVIESPRDAHLRPLVIVDCPRDAALVDGGHFGPVVAVLRVRDVVDALQVHHRQDQHLATSIFTSSAARARELRAMLGSTTVTVNDAILPTGHPAASIGGRGESGWGVSRGREGLLAMTRPVFVSRTAAGLRAPVDHPSPRIVRLVRWLAERLYGGPLRPHPHRDSPHPAPSEASPAGSPAPTARR